MAYYGVFIPSEKKNALIEEDAQLVFSDRNEAFKMLKKVRESRVKSFKTYEEAYRFSKCGLESPTETEIPLIIISAEINGVQSNGTGNNNVNCDKNSSKASPMVGEKTSNFRGPTSQELIKFRKMIEQGDKESAQNLIKSNPRYLVSSGDTPTILKESFRYNALHVAAISKNAEMTILVLETVGDPEFIKLLHGKDDDRTAEDVSNILLDLYLNMPEKGRGETPLHLATKFGAASVVEVLTSYRECQSNRNTEGYLPKDIVCSRVTSPDPAVAYTIRTLLEGRFYVPVMRSIDNSTPPVIGEPFMETQLPNQVPANDLLSPKMEIRAIAGPMNKEQAETFRKRWKTPPRALGSPAAFLKSPVQEQSPINGSPLSSYPNMIIRQRCTPSKTPQREVTPTLTIEKTSRRLFDNNVTDDENIAPNAAKMLFRNYRDHSHNDSLNDSMIMATPSLNSLSEISFNENQYNSPGFRERNLKLADVDKGLEVIGRGLAKDQRVTWREHWAFLDEFIDISSNEGLTKFEMYLQDRLDERMKPPSLASLTQRKFQLTPLPVTPVSKISQKLNKLRIEKDPHDESFNHARASTPSSPNAFHAYLCVEKSCQIYANRLLKPIAQNPTNIVTVNDVLVGELNRLKSLICSYKHDIRFFAVDFQATHSRFAHIVVALLNNDPEYQEHKVSETLQSTLDHILHAKEKSALSASKNGNSQDELAKNTTQLICLIKQLLKRLNDSSNLIPPEVLTTETDCADIWHGEEKCECDWANSPNNKLNRSIKRKNRLSETFGDFCDRLNIRSEENETDEEDDAFLSLEHSEDEIDSSDEEFFTPPQSPVLEFFDNSDPKILYDNFIFGQEPTKMDNDVLNALHNVDIDKNSYPNIYQWHTTLLRYSLEERASFPQTINTNANTLKSPSPCRTFSRTPIKSILPRISQFQLKPSKFQ
ncbi:ankyrin repeat and LEM domain-containing protein 2 homolog isoform X3 [Sitodiplosis mosellana]|uniref:ankyrin repeat and LEM domain-containing protein 2 homolog isoform X3 n=1 Tax=Sitodiplosis mosellana TaxID=263140 RepID=UPI002443CE35|nr:ankyrin repeat and LEM domain-containing protein 2 homolog isoform X3 [Sitodiplosis mosellana]